IKIQQNYVNDLIGKQGKETDTINISIQGIEGSYSYLASQKFFAHSERELEIISHKRFEDVVKSVENGEADYAILPIENTTSGGINEVYDLLLHTTLSIVGEETFKVKHCLVSTADTSIRKLKKIYAHYQAATQCSKFIESIPNASIEYFADTALSVQKIKEEDNPEYGAIASEEAANLFKVNILRQGIANQTENFTRFLIAARKPVEVDTRIPSKTSLVMATSHTAGSLADALSIFRKYNVNLTKLESRPILGNPWEEMFYLDFAGSINDETVQSVLDDLGIFTRFFKVLGSYPSQEIRQTKLESMLGTDDTEDKKQPAEVKVEEKPKKKKAVSYKLASRDYKSEDTIIKVQDVEIGGDQFIV
ncbi:MAG: 3-deoxy-D-arabinoheptulosonate-7-phosphate synthase, partial [Candidatus Heimdallarchaeota archaeon]|nr:3-deoxy-D-arabinoheptulosonate-7-phosphate synthase [Candidatus Heimdallarchaeota archaeon]